MPIYQKIIPTPLGNMLAVADDDALIRFDFTIQQASLQPTESIILSRFTEEVDAYFNKNHKKFNTPIKLETTMFQTKTLLHLQSIPYGNTISYKELANAIEKPRSIRAVANSCGKNPLLIIVPCHRVIAHNGKIGGFSAGIDKKLWLLQHENSIKLF